MRLAVLSDIHANLPALEAVLGAIKPWAPDAYLFAGDLVGYGPFPNECVELVSQLDNIVAVAGNHDLIVVGALSDRRCIPLARLTLGWTATVLSAAALAYLRSLPRRAEAFGTVVTHGALDNPETYVRRPSQVVEQLHHLHREHPDASLLILGHTHRAGAWTPTGAPAERRGGTVSFGAQSQCLLNPGSVGQSRELAVVARGMLVDTDRRTARLLRVPYDTARCRSALRRAGLPHRTYHLPPWETARPPAAIRRVVRRLVRSR